MGSILCIICLEVSQFLFESRVERYNELMSLFILLDKNRHSSNKKRVFYKDPCNIV